MQIIRRGENTEVGSENGFMEKVTFKMTKCPPKSSSFKISNCACVHVCVGGGCQHMRLVWIELGNTSRKVQ